MSIAHDKNILTWRRFCSFWGVHTKWMMKDLHLRSLTTTDLQSVPIATQAIIQKRSVGPAPMLNRRL